MKFNELLTIKFKNYGNNYLHRCKGIKGQVRPR